MQRKPDTRAATSVVRDGCDRAWRAAPKGRNALSGGLFSPSAFFRPIVKTGALIARKRRARTGKKE
jgi:hypothetical protein